jgi:subtilisin family serine protease
VRALALRVAAVAVLVALTAGVAPAAYAQTTPAPAPQESPGVDPMRAQEYWLDAYGIRKAWETTRGKGVKIAVIDTGIG